MCVECGADQPPFEKSIRHVITADEKQILDAAIAYVTQGDDLDNCDELYVALEQAVAKIHALP